MREAYVNRRRKKRGPVCGILSVLILLCFLAAGIYGCRGRGSSGQEDVEELAHDTTSESYGVFLGVDNETFRIGSMDAYDFLVVDAQELSKEQLAQLHAKGHTVFSYLNIGSIEETRDYYGEYRDLRLGRYENWPEEDWIDVADPAWIDFVTGDLLDKILEKDPRIDGLFLDNLDIYMHLQESPRYRSHAEDVYDALVEILSDYREAGIPVMINGADEFTERLLEEGNAELVYGINQETVFTEILDYDHDRFAEQDEEERERLKEYLGRCRKAGLDIFLLEYTTDNDLAGEIVQFCQENDYRLYISEHVDLIGDRKE